MSVKVAVILSGCGVFDGSEIHESVSLLIALSAQGVAYQCYAPDRSQTEVIDHAKSLPTDEQRSVLAESARIARGDVLPLTASVASKVDAAFFPGGFGVAKQLSDFAKQQADMTVQSDVLAFGRAMVAAKNPMGFMCIAPILMPHFYPKGIRVTLGRAGDEAKQLETMGAVHVQASASEVVVDEVHRAASTPAYMLAQQPHEILNAAQGLVAQVMSWVEGD